MKAIAEATVSDHPSGSKERGASRQPKSRSGVATRVPWSMADLRNRHSVWTINPKGFSEAHFATFPPELPTLCIKAGTERKGVVLDPFAGAGTTLLVAKKLGRHFLGIELSEEYCRMLTRRLAKVEPMPHMKNPRKPNNSQFEYFNVLED